MDSVFGTAAKQIKPQNKQNPHGERKKKDSQQLTALRISHQWTLPSRFSSLFQVESLLKTCIIHVALFYAKSLVPPSVPDDWSAGFPGRRYLPKSIALVKYVTSRCHSKTRVQGHSTARGETAGSGRTLPESD